MPIRWKNIDKERGGMLGQPHEFVALGDVVSNTTEVYRIFVAPQDCIVNRVNLYVNNSASQASGDFMHIELRQLAPASNTLQSQITTTASGGGYDISSCQAYGISVSSHNSLSRGNILMLTVSAVCSVGLCNVLAQVIWTPKDHNVNWSAVG